MAAPIAVTKSELLQAKRAVVVLSEVSKVAFKEIKTTAPLELMQDTKVLVALLRRLEAIAQ